jgi:hypothetical protein
VFCDENRIVASWIIFPVSGIPDPKSAQSIFTRAL